MERSAVESVKIPMASYGKRRQKRKVMRLTRAEILRVMEKSISTLLLSSLPLYWAPSTWKAAIIPDTVKFCTNCIWVARDTAAIEFWSREPSIMVSEAPTRARSRF